MVHNQTGSAFGNYQLLRPVGWGGMSVVYHALQPDSSVGTLAPGNVTEVAIKIMNTHKEDALNFYRRFQREVRVASALAHPHILPVCDYGTMEDQLYLVMPYMAHGTLEHRLKERKLLTLNEAVILATQIGQALDHAHSQNIIHRDVKPHNIMVGGENSYYLTDFGLVKILDGSTRLTMSGRIIGTPAYMSPEQASGAELDHRTDLYSLGIVLYECLVGRLPYLFETQSQAIGQHLNARAISPRRINPRFPASVEHVLLHALEKDPSKRFRSASEMVAALEKAAKQCPESLRDSPLVTPEQIQQSRVAAVSSSKSWVAARKSPVSMWGFAGALILSLTLVFSMQSGSINIKPLVDALGFYPAQNVVTRVKSSPSTHPSVHEAEAPPARSSHAPVERATFNQMTIRYVPPAASRLMPDDRAALEMDTADQHGDGSSPADTTVGNTGTPSTGNGVGNGNGNNGGGTGSNSNNGNNGGSGSIVEQGNGNNGGSDQPAETGNGSSNGNANSNVSDKPAKDK